MVYKHILLAIMAALLLVKSQNISNRNGTLLIILLDGFRWDYLTRATANGGFSKFKSTGSQADHLVPVYPSETYPNLYSILTGLYPEKHGFVAKIMYDRTTATIFYSYDGADGKEPYWWNQTDPIWITSTQQGKRTSVYSWPGCAVSIRGVMPYMCQRGTIDHEAAIFENNLQEALIRLAKNEIRFALVYSDHAGEIGLHFGPQSKEMNETIHTFDGILDRLATAIQKDHRLHKNLDVIILSDHGMADYPMWDKQFSIFKFIVPDDIEFVTSFGTEVGVYPKADKLNKVFEELRNLTFAYVWKQQDIPETLHVKRHSHTPPILVMAKPGYAFVRIPNTEKQKPVSLGVLEYKGIHGYNPALVPEMNGIFLVNGSSFRENVTIPDINVVDVYNMMTCILNITGHPNNGSWHHICPLMAIDCYGECTSHAPASGTSFKQTWLIVIALWFITWKLASPEVFTARI